MKKIKGNGIVICIIIIMAGMNTYAVENRTKKDSLEYIYAFTEATKQALFGNYKHAIALYNKCLEKYEDKSAVYFQLSNIYMKLKKNEIALYYAEKAVENQKEFNKWYLLHLANMYQIKSDYEKARNIYKELYEKLNGNLEITYGLAKLQGINKNYKEAIILWDEIEEMSGINQEVKIEKHDLYKKLNEMEEAEEELLELIKYYPEEIKFYGILAEYYVEEGLEEKAKHQYDSIFKKDPSNVLALFSYGEFARKTGNIKEALNSYEKIIKNKNVQENLKFELCIDILNREEFKTYKDEIFKIIETYDRIKNDYNSRSLIAEFYIRYNEYDNAIDIIDDMLKKDEKNIKLWEQSMILEYILEKYDKLLERVNYALTIFNKESKFYYYKGLVELNRKEYNETVKTLNTGMEYIKDNELKEKYYSLLGECYYYLNEYEKSDKNFEMALKINPENLVVKNNYSYYLALRNVNLKKALELSEYTIEKEPLNGTYLDTYGWILFRMGKTKKAKYYVKKAMENGEKENPEVMGHLAEILIKEKRKEEAIAVLKIAIEIDKENEELKYKLEKLEYKINEK